MGLPGQGVNGWYGMPALKTVNNFTIKCEMKRKKNGRLVNVDYLYQGCLIVTVLVGGSTANFKISKLVIIKFITLS